jgi:hypothetical protein
LAVNGVSGALGGGCIHVGQEHDASGLGTADITPMSATRWIAMKNGASYNKSGTATLGGFVVKTVNSADTYPSPVGGTAPNLTPTAEYYTDTTWGRDTYLFVDRRRVDNSSTTIHPAADVTSGATASFIVDATTGVYAGQAVAGTGIDAGTLVSKVWASASKKATGTNAATTVLTSGAPGVDQIVTGTGIAAGTRVTEVKTFNTVSKYFDASSGSATLTLNGGNSWSTDITVGQQVVGAGIPKNTYVTATNGSTTVTLSQNTTAALSNTSVTFGDNSRATGNGTSLTIEAANAHILVGAVVSGTGIASGSVVTAVSGTTVTLSIATSAALSNGSVSFTKNTVTLSNALTADLANSSVTFEKTVKLSKATTAALTSASALVLTSPSYDPVLARALDYTYSGSLTYQGGPLFGTATQAARATTATATSGGTTLTLPTGIGARVAVGETVVGTNIAPSTTVSSISGDVVTISNATTAALSSTAVTFGYSYSQMSTTLYPSFPASSVAAVKLKFGFLPASTQPTNEYAH